MPSCTIDPNVLETSDICRMNELYYLIKPQKYYKGIIIQEVVIRKRSHLKPMFCTLNPMCCK